MTQETPYSLPTRPTFMEVDLAALQHNYRCLAAHVAPARLMAVLKANAYGHGLVRCAQALVDAGAPSLGVAFVEEGIELRRAGITVPILVFGGLFGEQIDLFLAHNLEVTASSIAKLRAIDARARALGTRARVHLKIDTGMERIGVHYYSARQFIEEAFRSAHITVAGVFSHCATADEEDTEFMNVQLSRFLAVCADIPSTSPAPLLHIGNSAAALRSRATHLDMVRPGLALYGVPPAPTLASVVPLKPVMQLKTTVVYFKAVQKGATVGYGRSWTAPELCRVVTIPIGYGDGYSRALSNRGSVLIRGRRYPIVGRVNMDQIMVNIGMEEAYNGDEVVLIGAQGSDRISVQEVADLAGTIPWEILTSINLRVPRKYG